MPQQSDLLRRERGLPNPLKNTPMQPTSNGPNQPLYYQDATALAALIRTKQVTPREVVQAHLDRISAINPALNALVTLLADEALQAADAAGKAVLSGAPSGPCVVEPVRIPALEKEHPLALFNQLHVMELKPAFAEATAGHEAEMFAISKAMLGTPDTAMRAFLAEQAAERLRDGLPPTSSATTRCCAPCCPCRPTRTDCPSWSLTGKRCPQLSFRMRPCRSTSPACQACLSASVPATTACPSACSWSATGGPNPRCCTWRRCWNR